MIRILGVVKGVSSTSRSEFQLKVGNKIWHQIRTQGVGKPTGRSKKVENLTIN